MNKLEGEKSWINLKNYSVSKKITLYGFEAFFYLLNFFFTAVSLTILEFIAINHQHKEKEKETLYNCLFFLLTTLVTPTNQSASSSS